MYKLPLCFKELKAMIGTHLKHESVNFLSNVSIRQLSSIFRHLY
jgi:hypothetical protein